VGSLRLERPYRSSSSWMTWFGWAAGVAVAIERPRGGLVEALLERGLHVYSLNPKQLDRFRDRHTVAGAKDDRLDAYVLADALRTDRPRFRRVHVEDPLVVQIRELSRIHEDLRAEENRLINRFREQVHRCAPQLLTLCPAGNEPWFWALVERAVGPGKTGPRRRGIEKLLKQHRIRRIDVEEVYRTLQEPGLHLAPGTLEAARTHLDLLLPRLRVTREQARGCQKKLESLLDELVDDSSDDGNPTDVDILRSLPGVGPIIMGTLLAEAAPLLVQRDVATLRAYGGSAPITRRSGKRWAVQMRRGCNPRLRNALYHWARVSTTCDPAARAYYAELRARGHTHGRALRSVADRWIRILMAMLRDRTLYQRSAFDRYAIRAFEVNALDFLLKPVAPHRLAATIARLGRSTTAEKAAPGSPSTPPLTSDDRLFLRLDERMAFVRVRDIVAILAAGDDSDLLLADGRSARIRKPLRAWAERLPEQDFVRIHRSTMVNLKYVERVEEWSHRTYQVYLRGLTEPLQMSRRCAARLRSRLG
jgi:transposase